MAAPAVGVNPYLAAGGMALSTIGSLIGGNKQAKLNEQQMKDARGATRFDQIGAATQMQRDLDSDEYKRTNQNMLSPARQQILQALAGRLGIQGGVKFGPTAAATQSANPLGQYMQSQGAPSQRTAMQATGTPGFGVQSGATQADTQDQADRDIIAQFNAEKDRTFRTKDGRVLGTWLDKYGPQYQAAVQRQQQKGAAR